MKRLRITQQMSAIALVFIVAAVFTVGNFTDWFGPYSDTLHLIILSGVLFFTFLAWAFVYGSGARR